MQVWMTWKMCWAVGLLAACWSKQAHTMSLTACGHSSGTYSHTLGHLHNVGTPFFCPHTFLSSDFQRRDDVCELQYMLRHCEKLLCKSHLQMNVVHMHPFSDEGKPTACPSQPGGPAYDLVQLSIQLKWSESMCMYRSRCHACGCCYCVFERVSYGARQVMRNTGGTLNSRS